LSRLTAYLFSL